MRRSKVRTSTGMGLRTWTRTGMWMRTRTCMAKVYRKHKFSDYPVPLANGHTTLNTPLLVRSAKLSNVGSG